MCVWIWRKASIFCCLSTVKNFNSLFTGINEMAVKYDMPILYSCHPRSRKHLEASGFMPDNLTIRQDPLGFQDDDSLQMNVFSVSSDFEMLSEKSSFC